MLHILRIQRLPGNRLLLMGALFVGLLLLMVQSGKAAPHAADLWNEAHCTSSPISVGDESHHQETDAHLLLRTQQHRTVRNAATMVALQAAPVGQIKTWVPPGFRPSPWIEYASPHLAYIHRFFLF
jgi:hypothetical protein